MHSRPVRHTRSAHSHLLLFFTLLLALFHASSAIAQTVVYDSLTTGSQRYGSGAYAIDNFDDGNAALGFGSFPAYNGQSPTFEFVPTGIPSGDNLIGFNVGIGTSTGSYIGPYNFHLTLFTSGATEDLNPSDWTSLGSWAGQTGWLSSGAVVVAANLTSGAPLTNGDYYYLMATADANQGLDASGYNYLDWAENFAFVGYAWEPLLSGYQTGPLQYTATGVFQVLVGPSVNGSLVLSPAILTGGNSGMGTVTLTFAPSVDVAVALASSDTRTATVPATVTVPAGQTSATFTVTSKKVAVNKDAIISATLNAVTLQATLVVTSAKLLSVTLSPGTVTGGKSAAGRVTLSSVAPAGGFVVSLVSSIPDVASLPDAVTVPFGAKTVTFAIATVPVMSLTKPVITAAFGGGNRNATLMVKDPVISALSLSPRTVKGGKKNSVGTITLTGNAPAGGLIVNLTSSDTSTATVAAMVTVPAGQKTVTFPVTSLAVIVQEKVVITGNTGSVSRVATLVVNP